MAVFVGVEKRVWGRRPFGIARKGREGGSPHTAPHAAQYTVYIVYSIHHMVNTFCTPYFILAIAHKGREGGAPNRGCT